ncbi:SRPBCC family protein [Micromonospora sp. NBC_01813]|uniref:SRPBCC family protein n=1 Tax=Micromonospora sp. NBC_01813 TaxID=2975988 RepID=UPI002DDB3779|nr:SRPBCC domain-containing protein [Micromonospora sp. NBC_01813]WSA09407.1 SRPBCC domain-containing protein [Micromonospora sp. NBC_01813]
MAVVSSHKDTEALTLTTVAEFAADVERVWQLWQDPRQLERWWGPPTWPATFEEHELTVGARSRYYMTGPEGEKSRGWWTITAVDAPHRLELDDGFADENGEPAPGTPMHMTITIEPIADGARMTIDTRFVDLEQLEQMVAMGMEEGLRQAVGQITVLLTERP